MREDKILILECLNDQSGWEYYKGCGHRWAEIFNFPMSFEVFLAKLRGAARCPKCESDVATMLLLGTKYRDAYKEMFGKEGG